MSQIFLFDGVFTISSESAGTILRECYFDGQSNRHTQASGVAHVRKFITLLERGDFLDRSQISFARLGRKLYLVNGYHRLSAVHVSGITATFQVTIHEVATEQEMRTLYAKFDTETRVRSKAQVLNASGVMNDFDDISPLVVKAAFNAMPIIESRFALRGMSLGQRSLTPLSNRAEMLLPWRDQIELYAEVINLSTHKNKRFYNAGLTSVALATLRYQPAKAVEFWSEAFANDGLRRGDPRKALIEDIATRSSGRGDWARTGIPAAYAWNAFFKGRELTHIRITSSARFYLEGTPFVEGRSPQVAATPAQDSKLAEQLQLLHAA